MAWIQLGLQEYECSREPEEPLRCFDRALALEPKRPPLPSSKEWFISIVAGMNRLSPP